MTWMISGVIALVILAILVLISINDTIADIFEIIFYFGIAIAVITVVEG